MSREVSKFREKLEKLTHARSLDTRPFFFLPRAKRAARLPAREKRGTGDEATKNGEIPLMANMTKYNSYVKTFNKCKYTNFALFSLISSFSICNV